MYNCIFSVTKISTYSDSNGIDFGIAVISIS
jgi:hypothetical protein